MNILIDKNGTEYPYVTLAWHEHSVTIDNGLILDGVASDFTLRPAVYDLLTPMQFYMAFTPAERVAIKASKDKTVAEFWASYQLATQLGSHIDPNLKSVADGIVYLATQPTDGPGILASLDRVEQIKRGIPQ